MIKQQAIAYFSQAKEYAKSSNCLKRKVGAVLILEDKSVYLGANGGLEECTDGCTRDIFSIEGLEHKICPSKCAEGETFVKAYVGGKELKGSTLVTTGFPCSRCKNIIIDVGLKEIYFSDYKDEIPRMADLLFQNQIIINNVSVYKILETEGNKIIQLYADPVFSGLAMRGMRNNGNISLSNLAENQTINHELLKKILEKKRTQENLKPDILLKPLL